MSKDKSDDEEVYGPPTGGHVLPDENIAQLRKQNHKGLEGFETS